jgi:predicted RNA methylase
MTQQDTGKFRTNTKDQYYTNTSVAKECVDHILVKLPHTKDFQWIEPSAGNGSFLKAIPKEFDRIGIDIDPKAIGILKGDFLEWSPTTSKKRIVFGNPPFGRQSSLAKGFIKHACSFADVVAFILPRSFVKPSMSRAFPLPFHCIFSEEISKNAFEVNGQSYDVPCIFQIWEKRNENRKEVSAVKEEGFQYVKSTETYHIAFKRVGGLAGQCSAPPGTFNPQYHYFLKLDEANIPYCKKIIEQVNQHVFPSNTVGPRSLSKSEANEVLNVILQEISS